MRSLRGVELGKGNTGFFSWYCNFSGSKTERTIYFYNQTPPTTKALLLSNGVKLYQNIYSHETAEITANNTQRLTVGYWSQPAADIAFTPLKEA